MADLFFDSASTTSCCPEALELIAQFSTLEYGNPSSAHSLGQRAAQAITAARSDLAQAFGVSPGQVIFTGSGSESDNLAVYGVIMDALAKKVANPKILVSATEHPGVRKTALSAKALGVQVELIPVDEHGQIKREEFLALLTPNTLLVSIQRVNNIVGSLLPVEELAQLAKDKVPSVLFHTDAVQAFARVDVPKAPSAVDMVSISAHKIRGPKGIGALILLNPKLLKEGLRPIIWGGDQEGGFRSGTQSPALISGFHAAVLNSLNSANQYLSHTKLLHERLEFRLKEFGLYGADGRIKWNSPRGPNQFVPYIVNLSVPGIPGGILAQFLEERRCLVSTGSACSSKKSEPDPVLCAMGFPAAIYSSAVRISFSSTNQLQDIDILALAIKDSIEAFDRAMQ